MKVLVNTGSGSEVVLIPFGGALLGYKIISVKLTTEDFHHIITQTSEVGREHMAEYLIRIASKVVLD